jgi:hypothetical protein
VEVHEVENCQAKASKVTGTAVIEGIASMRVVIQAIAMKWIQGEKQLAMEDSCDDNNKGNGIQNRWRQGEDYIVLLKPFDHC